jgi:hypothetical protein
MQLSSVYARTGPAVSDLPQSDLRSVNETVTATDLNRARDIVADLTRRANACAAARRTPPKVPPASTPAPRAGAKPSARATAKAGAKATAPATAGTATTAPGTGSGGTVNAECGIPPG